MHRITSATILAVLIAALTVGTAAADPHKGANAYQFPPFTCDDGRTVTIVTASNFASSGHIVESTGVLIFRSGSGVLRDANNPDIILAEFSFTQGNGKKTGLQGDLVTCWTTDISVPGEIAEYEFVFTFVPRGQS